MPTPHINAEPGDFAESVLLPGDPLRAQYIAEHFLEDAKLVTSVRNMLGFTGTYEGVRVSAMGTGMGIPSASIYATELIDHYGVRNLIRVGSCGAISRDLGVRDVVLAIGASTDSGVNRARYGGYDYAATADYGLLSAAAGAAADLDVSVAVGNIHSADLFYNPQPEMFDTMERMGILAVEMEAAGLYAVAAERRARSLAILTVSDHIRTGEATTSEEREQTFTDMMRIALETVKRVATGG